MISKENSNSLKPRYLKSSRLYDDASPHCVDVSTGVLGTHLDFLCVVAQWLVPTTLEDQG